MKKDVAVLLRRAEQLGCSVESVRRHIKIRCPNGQLVVMSHSPSDVRALRNVRAHLRTLGGLDI